MVRFFHIFKIVPQIGTGPSERRLPFEVADGRKIQGFRRVGDSELQDIVTFRKNQDSDFVPGSTVPLPKSRGIAI